MLPCCVVKQNSQKRLARLSSRAQTTGRFIRKPNHTITRAETTGCERRGSGSVCASEFGPVRVDDFGPTDADEDVVQEAEELEHVPAPILLSKADVEPHNVSHLSFRSWCSACVRGRRLSLGHRKVDTKTKRQNRFRLLITDSLDNWKTEHMTYSSAHRARSQE